MSEQLFVGVATAGILALIGFSLKWVHQSCGLNVFVVVCVIAFALIVAAAFRLEATDRRDRGSRERRSDWPDFRS